MMEWNENPKKGGGRGCFSKTRWTSMFMTSGHTPPPTRKLTGRAGKSTMNESLDAFPMGKWGIYQLVIRFFLQGVWLWMKIRKFGEFWPSAFWFLKGWLGGGKTTEKKAFFLAPFVFQKPFFNEGLQQLPFNRFLWCFQLFLSRCFSLLFPPLSSPPCRCPVRHGSTFWAWQWTGLTVALAWAHDWCRARCRWLSSSMPGRRCSTWGWYFFWGGGLGEGCWEKSVVVIVK